MAESLPEAVPVLPVADLMRSVAFYERLGFTPDALYPSDDGTGYAILAFGATEIHLSEDPAVAEGPSRSGVYLRVADVDALHASWTALGAREVHPPIDQAYGIREFATEDPDGNLWRIGANIAGHVPEPSPGTATVIDPELGAPVLDEAVAAAEIAAFHQPLGFEVDEAGLIVGSGAVPAVELDEPGGPRVDPTATDGLAATDGLGGAGALAGAGAPALADERAGTQGSAASDGRPGTGDDAWYRLVAEGERCAGCGFAFRELPARALGAEARDVVHEFGRILLAADDDAVRRRPAADSWSALEYGVHVRDVLRVFADRIVLTLAQDHPELAWWDHEAAIDDGMANESDVSAVADDMGRNASHLSEALRRVTEDDWDRSATRTGPDGTVERFTIELLARYALHEAYHHRHDAEQLLG